ncbi:hypothetical protein EV09_0639 [Prochlorococcus marinus str. SS35]|nr:hypothetical protein EV09_0639 [Prochlorococcus marinus str. SS35]
MESTCPRAFNLSNRLYAEDEKASATLLFGFNEEIICGFVKNLRGSK